MILPRVVAVAASLCMGQCASWLVPCEPPGSSSYASNHKDFLPFQFYILYFISFFLFLADFYATKAAALGEDPLREGANPEAVWNKVSSSKKPIGLLLMDQSVIAGVGNIYRAEILFKASIHPEQPGNTLPREAFDSIWAHSVALLRRGFETGSILTVDPEEAAVLGPPWTRRYIYNQARCGRCKGPVKVRDSGKEGMTLNSHNPNEKLNFFSLTYASFPLSLSALKTWDMASRTVYCCTACQPLVASAAAGAEGDLPQARKKAMAGAVQAVQFRSHCAPDDDGHVATPPSKLSVAELKKRLTAAGLPTNGRKAELIARLQSGVDQDSAHAATAVGVKEEPEPAAVLTPLPAQRKRAQRRGAGTDSRAGGTSDVVFPEVYAWGGEDVSGAGPSPGTIGVGHVATPLEAALEKAAAGEGRNVEHVALHEDDVMNEVGAGARKAKRLRGGKS